MYELVLRFDALPGKIAELDRFLAEHIQECPKALGAKSVCIYEDAIVGYPEREVRVAFDSLADLQKVLAHEEWKRDREALLSLATNVSSQIVTPRVCA